jgi:hypothetical protein
VICVPMFFYIMNIVLIKKISVIDIHNFKGA